MTKTLEKALAQVAQLTPKGQNAIAAIILQELESDRKWNDLLDRSGGLLDKLAENALAHHRAGRTKPLKSVLKAK